MTLESTLHKTERAACAACSDLLFTGEQWARSGHLLLLTALLGIIDGGSSGWGGQLVALLLLALVHQYLAVRVLLDARLFDRLVRGHVLDLCGLDEALQTVLGVPASKAGRLLTSRMMGAKRLYQGQLGVIFLIAGLNVMTWLHRC